MIFHEAGKKTEKAGKPQIRFVGFDDEWEQHKLEDIVDIQSGKDYKHLLEGDIPVYGTGGYMLSVNEALSDSKDAIGIGRKGTIDKPYILKAPFWTVDTLFYAIPKEKYNLNFVFDIFENIDWKKKDESTGVPSLSKTVINEVDVLVPKIDEQNNIGIFFEKINHFITLYQSKYDKLIDMKKAMLEKMFPKDGEAVPEIRFKGFSDAWEQRKLGDITISYSGGTPTVGIKEYYGGKIPFIRSAEINSDNTELFITEEGLNNSSAKLVSEGDILYALYGATSGEVGRARINGAINQAILVIKPLFDYDTEYITQWLRKSKQSIIETYLQGGQGNLSSAIVKELLVEFPSFKEQYVIGMYFKRLDHLITLHQRKLEKLKNLKKAFLEKMFI